MKRFGMIFTCPQNRERRELRSSRNPEDPTKILIVVDMLLMGYDAPMFMCIFGSGTQGT